MNAIFTIALNDLRIFFAQRGNLIGLVVLPVLFTLVLGWAFGGNDDDPQRLRVDVIDRDQTDASARFLHQLRAANDALVLCPYDNDAADFCSLEDEPLDHTRALQRVRSAESAALLVIPAGYADALAQVEPAQIDFYATGDPALPHPVEQTINAVLQRVNSAALTAGVTDALLGALDAQTNLGALVTTTRDQFVQNLYAEAQVLVEQRPLAVQYVSTTGDEGDATGSGFGQSVPGMGSMYVMFTVLGGMAVLVRERQQGTLQRLTVLPIVRAQILGGKALTYVILGLIQFGIVFAVGLLVGLDFGHNPLILLPVMLAFVFCCTAITFALAPRMQSETQANGVARLLSLSLAPLGGAWWPLEIVPDFMRRIAYLSPVAWAMDAFHSVMYYGGSLPDVALQIGVLLAAAAVLFGIGVRSFR